MTKAEIGFEIALHSSTPGPGEVASAAGVMLALVRAAKAIRIYLPNNQALLKSCDALFEKLVQHIESYGEMTVAVEQFRFRYSGAEIYHDNDSSGSLPFRLRADGIVGLQFVRGISREEIWEFLKIIGMENRQPHDIVTTLWETAFLHLHWALEEDLASCDEAGQRQPRRCQQDAISALLADVAHCYTPPPVMVPKHLLMLTGEEAEWLRKARQSEAERDPVEDVISIVSAILAGSDDPALFGDFAAISADTAAHLLVAGKIRPALRFLKFLRQLSNLVSLGPSQRQQVSQALERVASETAIPALQEAFDCGDPAAHEELKELFLVLGLPSVKRACELLGSVKKLKSRKTIIEALLELGKEDPQVFADYLRDDRWYLVRNMVLILSMLESPVALELIVALISHPEPRVRKEVLVFLERSADPTAKKHLLRFLRDPSTPLRVRALQVLVRESSPAALKAALAAASAEDFTAREDAEKKAVCEAIGVLGGDSAIPVLREILLKKHWFGKAKTVEKNNVHCAVAGLVKVNSTVALDLLEEARRQAAPQMEGVIREGIAQIVSRQRVA